MWNAKETIWSFFAVCFWFAVYHSRVSKEVAILKNEVKQKKEEGEVKCRRLHKSVTGDKTQKGVGGKKVQKEEVVSSAV